MVSVSGLPVETPIGAATTCEVLESGWERMPEVGPLESGWVCCILTVARGSAGALLFGASEGRLMRAVSFFGEAGFADPPLCKGAVTVGAGARPLGLGAAGFNGTVAFPVSGGGFGGGTALLRGLVGGLPGDGNGGGVASL